MTSKTPAATGCRCALFCHPDSIRGEGASPFRLSSPWTNGNATTQNYNILFNSVRIGYTTNYDVHACLQ